MTNARRSHTGEIRMKNRLRLAAIAMAAAVPLSALSTGVAGATNIGTEGCTPGYWKNHVEHWEEYKPTLQLRYVFKATATTRFAKVTMADALALKGGSGTDGSSQILLRAASAAVLNAAHEGIGYPYRRLSGFMITDKVNVALASGDRAKMIE